MGPVLERSSGTSAHMSVEALRVFEATAFHSSPCENRGILELLSSDKAFTESMPAAEHVPRFLEHVLGKQVRIGTAPAILESLEIANQMEPAQLSQSILVAAAIG